MMTILGIDPGSRITGYGVIQIQGSQLLYLASGCVITKSESLGEKLEQIYSGILQVIDLYHPNEAAIEQVFVNQNVNSALKLGQARGAALVAMAKQALSIHEYSARRIKQSVVGYGAADKAQVQHMVKCLLNLSGKPSADAADALAVAICHAYTRGKS